MKDLYAALGVPRDADQAAIKKAFKTLARKFHPDVNKDAGAQDRFKEISAAYEVLGDEEKRSLYDEFGEVSLRAGFNAEQARAFRNMGGFRPGADGGGPDLGSIFGAGGGGGPGGFGFEDLFSGLFTRGGGGARGPTGPRKGVDIEGRVVIDFLDAVRGAEIPLDIQRPGPCKACKGEGGRGRKPCPSCGGSGRKALRQLGLNVLVACDECAGAGSIWAEECEVCGGTGRGRDHARLNVRIPAGVESGRQVRLRGQGGLGQASGPPGDLILDVEVRPHALLRREGRDLEMDLPLTLKEAIGGAAVEVPTPTGKVRVKVPPGSANGKRLRIPGKGVQSSPPGDLYLVLRPQIPEATDPDTVELAERLDARGGEREIRGHLTL